MRPIAPLVRAHHERWDGSGYPDGVARGDIPLGARIIGVADAFNAMVTTRPYRDAIDPDLALAELKRCSGTQFDPRVVAAMDRALRAPQALASASALPPLSEIMQGTVTEPTVAGPGPGRQDLLALD